MATCCPLRSLPLPLHSSAAAVAPPPSLSSSSSFFLPPSLQHCCSFFFFSLPPYESLLLPLPSSSNNRCTHLVPLSLFSNCSLHYSPSTPSLIPPSLSLPPISSPLLQRFLLPPLLSTSSFLPISPLVPPLCSLFRQDTHTLSLSPNSSPLHFSSNESYLYPLFICDDYLIVQSLHPSFHFHHFLFPPQPPVRPPWTDGGLSLPLSLSG